jgi:ABC-type nitrate/sulfonate/bicarbonate transport system ATPase subunit
VVGPEILQKPYRELSGGMKQQVLILGYRAIYRRTEDVTDG